MIDYVMKINLTDSQEVQDTPEIFREEKGPDREMSYFQKQSYRQSKIENSTKISKNSTLYYQKARIRRKFKIYASKIYHLLQILGIYTVLFTTIQQHGNIKNQVQAAHGVYRYDNGAGNPLLVSSSIQTEYVNAPDDLPDELAFTTTVPVDRVQPGVWSGASVAAIQQMISVVFEKVYTNGQQIFDRDYITGDRHIFQGTSSIAFGPADTSSSKYTLPQVLSVNPTQFEGQFKIIMAISSTLFQFETETKVFDFGIHYEQVAHAQSINVPSIINDDLLTNGGQNYIDLCTSWIINTNTGTKKKRTLIEPHVVQYQDALDEYEPIQLQEFILSEESFFKHSLDGTDDYCMQNIASACIDYAPELFRYDHIELVFSENFDHQTHRTIFDFGQDKEFTYMSYNALLRQITLKMEEGNAWWPTEVNKHAALLFHNSALGFVAQKDILFCKIQRQTLTPSGLIPSNGKFYYREIRDMSVQDIMYTRKDTTYFSRYYIIFDKISVYAETITDVCGVTDSDLSPSLLLEHSPDMHSMSTVGSVPRFILEDLNQEEFAETVQYEYKTSDGTILAHDKLEISANHRCTFMSPFKQQFFEDFFGSNPFHPDHLPLFLDYQYELYSELDESTLHLSLEESNYENKFYMIYFRPEKILICPKIKWNGFNYDETKSDEKEKDQRPFYFLQNDHSPFWDSLQIKEKVQGQHAYPHFMIHPLEMARQIRKTGSTQVTNELKIRDNNLEKNEQEIYLQLTIRASFFQGQQYTLFLNPHLIGSTTTTIFEFRSTLCSLLIDDQSEIHSPIFKIQNSGDQSNSIQVQNGDIQQVIDFKGGQILQELLSIDCKTSSGDPNPKSELIDILVCKLVMENIQITEEDYYQSGQSTVFEKSQGPRWDVDIDDADYALKIDQCNSAYSVTYVSDQHIQNLIEEATIDYLPQTNTNQIKIVNRVCEYGKVPPQFQVKVTYNNLNSPYEFASSHLKFNLSYCDQTVGTETISNVLSVLNDYPQFKDFSKKEYSVVPNQSQFLDLGAVYDPQDDPFYVMSWSAKDQDNKPISWVNLASIANDKTLTRVILGVNAPKQEFDDIIVTFSIKFKDVKNFIESKESPSFDFIITLEGNGKSKDILKSVSKIGERSQDKIEAFIIPISQLGVIEIIFSKDIILQEDFRGRQLIQEKQNNLFMQLFLQENLKKYELEDFEFLDVPKLLTWSFQKIKSDRIFIKVHFPDNVPISPSQRYMDSVVIKIVSTNIFRGKDTNSLVLFKQIENGTTGAIDYQIPPQITPENAQFVRVVKPVLNTLKTVIILQLTLTLLFFSPLIQQVFGSISTFQLQVIQCLFQIQMMPFIVVQVLDALMMLVSADLFNSEGIFQEIFEFSETSSLTLSLDKANFEGKVFVLLVGPMLLIFVYLISYIIVHALSRCMLRGYTNLPKFVTNFIKEKSYSLIMVNFVQESSLDIAICILISISNHKQSFSQFNDACSQILCYLSIIGLIITPWYIGSKIKIRQQIVDLAKLRGKLKQEIEKDLKEQNERIKQENRVPVIPVISSYNSSSFYLPPYIKRAPVKSQDQRFNRKLALEQVNQIDEKMKSDQHPLFEDLSFDRLASYNPMFFLFRRYFVALIIMWGQYERRYSICSFQVMGFFVCSSVFIMYYLSTRPFKEQSQNRLEIINEFFVIALAYHQFCFTEFMQSQQDVDRVGISFLSLIATNFVVNITFLAILQVKIFKATIRKLYAQRSTYRLKFSNFKLVLSKKTKLEKYRKKSAQKEPEKIQKTESSSESDQEQLVMIDEQTRQELLLLDKTSQTLNQIEQQEENVNFMDLKVESQKFWNLKRSQLSLSSDPKEEIIEPDQKEPSQKFWKLKQQQINLVNRQETQNSLLPPNVRELSPLTSQGVDTGLTKLDICYDDFDNHTLSAQSGLNRQSQQYFKSSQGQLARKIEMDDIFDRSKPTSLMNGTQSPSHSSIFSRQHQSYLPETYQNSDFSNQSSTRQHPIYAENQQLPQETDFTATLPLDKRQIRIDQRKLQTIGTNLVVQQAYGSDQKWKKW